MNLKIIYPKWEKLEHQPKFNLPPHGPVVFAAELDPSINVTFCDENVQDLVIDQSSDLVAISSMLTCQIQRAWEIADAFRSINVPVICGGLAVTLHPEETRNHSDSVFLGEVEGHFSEVISDFESGVMKKTYNYRSVLPDIASIKTARRDILDRSLYNYRGIQMVDLVHASRGCKYNCFPCCTPYLGGRKFRPRPIENVLGEIESIENNRLFFVDNSLGQDEEWVKQLFREMKPLKKNWISHPIKDDDEILDLAAEAGCWYVYQAVVDTSDYIKNRVKRLKERGIGVEGTIILGMDDHDRDYIKRLVDFLLEIDLDLAEFTVLTPFPHTRIREQFESEKRILSNDWSRYTCGDVVFQPKKMSPEELKEMYNYAWETFYKSASIEFKMAKLYLEVQKKEKEKGTYRQVELSETRNWKTSKK